jgi:hypothetical protein
VAAALKTMVDVGIKGVAFFDKIDILLSNAQQLILKKELEQEGEQTYETFSDLSIAPTMYII